jgi:hypothetical protein
MNKIIILLVTVMCSVGTAVAQFAAADFRPEQKWTFTKNDNVMTDTVLSTTLSVERTYGNSADDTTHSLFGWVTNESDTCTLTLQWRPVDASGKPIGNGAFTTIGNINGVVFLPNTHANIYIRLHRATGFVQLRAIRSRGTTQFVNNRFRVFFHNFYYSR